MIKLIATDMDGTFLDSNKQFDKEFLSLFYKLKEKKIKFVIASGNQYYRLYQKFIPLSEDMYFVAENGSYIAKGSTELYCNVIHYKNVLAIKDTLEKYDRLMVVYCGRKGAYVLDKNYQYRDEVKKYYCAYSFVHSFDDIHDDIMKIALFDKETKVKEFYDEIKAILPLDLRIVTSGNEWIDIQNKDGHKGLGIAFLQNIYDIEKEECMAFGDQMNDYEMLHQVKYSYAMENAVDAIKEIAYEVIDSNDEQGVIKKIKEVLENE